MEEVTLRMPRERWGSCLGVGFALVLLMIRGSLFTWRDDPNQKDLFLLAFGFLAGMFLLIGALAARKKLVLRPDGVLAQGGLMRKWYRWDEIEDVGVRNVHHSVNYIPTTVVRYVVIRVRGRDVELPAPRAGRFIGRQDFEKKALVFHRLWRLQTGRVRA